ncbi:uncharacterized protein LOC144709529 [Wolffia australiana]
MAKKKIAAEDQGPSQGALQELEASLSELRTQVAESARVTDVKAHRAEQALLHEKLDTVLANQIATSERSGRSQRSDRASHMGSSSSASSPTLKECGDATERQLPTAIHAPEGLLPRPMAGTRAATDRGKQPFAEFTPANLSPLFGHQGNATEHRPNRQQRTHRVRLGLGTSRSPLGHRPEALPKDEGRNAYPPIPGRWLGAMMDRRDLPRRYPQAPSLPQHHRGAAGHPGPLREPHLGVDDFPDQDAEAEEDPYCGGRPACLPRTNMHPELGEQAVARVGDNARGLRRAGCDRGESLPPVMPRHDRAADPRCHHARDMDEYSVTEAYPRVEHYFRSHPAEDGERLRVASSYLEGKASKWFCYKDDHAGFRSWDDFKAQLCRLFGLKPHQAYTNLFRMRQMGTVDELLDEFVCLVGYIPDLCGKTVKLEEEEVIQQSHGSRFLKPKETRDHRGNMAEHPTPRTTPGPKHRLRLTVEEVAQRKAQGLCFRCDEKFTPGHHCRKDLQIHLLQEKDAEGPTQIPEIKLSIWTPTVTREMR